VVIAEQMEETMDEQDLDLADKGVPRLPSLTFGLRNGNDDIAERVRPQIAESALAEREREHIRRAVDAPESPVQGTHGPVAREEDAQLGVRMAGTL